MKLSNAQAVKLLQNCDRWVLEEADDGKWRTCYWTEGEKKTVAIEIEVMGVSSLIFVSTKERIDIGGKRAQQIIDETEVVMSRGGQ